ncbi:MAG TPA: hypothetical protein VNH11_22820 [Pirellulales bacterium]|nr:hypothetical protein [Pirellulales bacterium]
MPAIVVFADQLAINAAYADDWSTETTVPVFVGFVLQTFLLSQGIGHWLPDWRWRLSVLAWAFALTNLQLYRAAIDGFMIGSNRWDRSHPSQILIYAVLTAQLSAVVVWLILATVELGRKLLLAAIAWTPPFITLLVMFGGYVSHRRTSFSIAILFVQFLATTVVSTWLCLRGWRIVYRATPLGEEPVGWAQFSIRHVLLATTVVAIAAAFAKAVMTNPARGGRWLELVRVAIDGGLLGALSLAAVWASLGSGRLHWRMLLLLVFAVASAALLWWIEAAGQAVQLLAVQSAPRFTWRNQPLFAGRWWIAWTVLSATFLASWLSVLRVTGYRLVRPQTR